MNGIKILVIEHDNILRMIEVIHKVSLKALQEKYIDIDDFKKIVGFIQKYADHTHHGKEEKYLFKAMLESLGTIGENLVRHGMLVEHDLARLYISELDTALEMRLVDATDENLLQVLVAIGSYSELLKRHIYKENNVVFPYGEKNLPRGLSRQVDDEIYTFEKESENIMLIDEQLNILESLERKYI